MRQKKDFAIRNAENRWVKRVCIDIKDLKLSRLLEEHGKSRAVVAISKHLCGSATDLTLQCLYQAEDKKFDVIGAVIALCCHHRCEYDKYCNRPYLNSIGVSRQQFDIICSLSSWATCRASDSSECGQEDAGENRWLLLAEERRVIGLKCKRLLDYGRMIYVTERLGGDDRVALMEYTRGDVSLENVAFVVSSI
eukprot:Partr_v1_DN28731_c1_g1_i3_m62210 putative tRNA methyltransferase 13 homolog (S. cerevisiae)